jgi:hypothetical protein
MYNFVLTASTANYLRIIVKDFLIGNIYSLLEQDCATQNSVNHKHSVLTGDLNSRTNPQTKICLKKKNSKKKEEKKK